MDADIRRVTMAIVTVRALESLLFSSPGHTDNSSSKPPQPFGRLFSRAHVQAVPGRTMGVTAAVSCKLSFRLVWEDPAPCCNMM